MLTIKNPSPTYLLSPFPKSTVTIPRNHCPLKTNPKWIHTTKDIPRVVTGETMEPGLKTIMEIPGAIPKSSIKKKGIIIPIWRWREQDRDDIMNMKDHFLEASDMFKSIDTLDLHQASVKSFRLNSSFQLK